MTLSVGRATITAMPRRRLAAVLAALALAASAFLTGASPAQAYLIAGGLWTETTFTSAPPLGHNRECYRVTSTNYVCETVTTGAYNWPGDNWYGVDHQVQRTTQRFGGSDPEWYCYNHGRVGFNASLTCFNPNDGP